jgi:predicted phosphodiesterase
MPVRLLHVSDLHADPRSAFDQRVLVDGLLQDVKRSLADAPFDLIVFSGDLASTGKAGEFEAGRRNLLDRLTEATGLGPDRVVLVPGNHDVDRDEIDRVYEDGLRLRLTSHEAIVAALDDDRQVSQALARLAAWTQFTDSYYAGVQRQAIAPGGWTMRLEISGVEVGIAALNSAWRSTGVGEEERGRLLVGEVQARTVLDRIADCPVRLVAVHHPFEWLADFDRKEVRREFERAGAMVMTGHEHEADPVHLVSGLGNSNHDRAGCLYFGIGYPNAYSVIDIDVPNAKTLVNVRTWQAKRREFDTGVDAAKGGVVELPLPRRSDGQLTVPHGNVAAALVELIRRTSVVADHLPDQRCSSVSELLVPPRFYPAPFPELAAATMQRGEMQVDQADGLAMLAQNRVVVLVGEREAGGTAAMAWLLEHRHEADPTRPALYIRFDLRQGKRVIDDDLSAAAAGLAGNRTAASNCPPQWSGWTT